MNFHLDEDQAILRETFARLFSNECTPERVRAAEPKGFDEDLWRQLVALGVPAMRVPEASGGAACSLLDACILAAEAGRYVAPVPVVEAVISSRLLAVSDADTTWLARQLDGATLVSIALQPVADTQRQLIPSGAIADGVICFRDGQLILVSGGEREALTDLGDSAIARWDLSGDTGDCTVLAEGERALEHYQAAIEEWKLLSACTLSALGQQALVLAAEYSVEREAFGQPIGCYQGLAHPMADAATEMEGARWLSLRANWELSRGHASAAAAVSMAWWWASTASSRAVARALHVFGGYGLSLESAIQLYHRRAKAWSLIAGDPALELERVADRLWNEDHRVALPGAGPTSLEFGYGEKAEAFATRAREFFDRHLTDELRAHAHHSWEGHHPGFQRQLADAGLLLPDWPPEFGGQGRDRYEMQAMARVFNDMGWTRNAIAVTDMVGKAILEFGSDWARSEILPRLTGGEAICCLGFSEPSCGSDVFAAQTRARRDGDGWVINGQKMFTSGADLADYVLLLTRTDPEAEKHAGLTMFILPMDSDGIEIQAVHTLADERTNITYYDDVRVADACRLGEVNGGMGVMIQSLSKEQDGSWFAWDQQRMVDHAVNWARDTERDGRRLIESSAVRQRLARASVHAAVSDVLSRQSLWNAAEGEKNRSVGPMSKLFASESYIRDSADLLDLMAPDSLLSGADAIHRVELDYRLSTATSIYAGSSEIMRSLIAENALNMPRTRN